MPQHLYEFVNFITQKTPTQAQISKYILSLRYYHKKELSSIITFAVLILSCNHLNYQREVNFSTIEQIFKALLLEADYFFILLTYCKLLPLLSWAQARPLREIQQTIGVQFRQLTKPISSSKLLKVNTHEQSRKCLNQHLQLLILLDHKNFFLFFFNLINGTNDSLQNDIDCYFMEFSSSPLEKEGLMSTSQLTIMQKNIELQYGKLRKRKYQQEVIEATYKWLQIQLQKMLFEGENQSNHLFMEVFTQVVRTQSNISGATLLQVLDTSVQGIQSSKVKNFLEIVDTCIMEGSYKISTQTILFLVCTIFMKIHSKKLSVRGEVVQEHLVLWKQVAIRKQLPVKLIICLIQWLPFLFQKPFPKSNSEPQILQLYRKQILRLTGAEEMSQISGLRVLIEELQYRKMEGIYDQLQQFHSQMEKPQQKHSLSQKQDKVSRVDFHFKVSKLSKSNSEINSLLNSFQIQSQNKAKSRNIQLQIISKSQQSGSFGSHNSERSFKECVQIIMSLIDLFDYHVRESSFADQIYTTTKNQTLSQLSLIQNSSLLPVVSTHKASSSSLREQVKISSNLSTKVLSIKVPSYSEETKKRMVKRRGLIIKNEILQIGYLFQSKECTISFLFTFLQPVINCVFQIRENSFKLNGETDTVFTEPKINKQFRVSHKIDNIKLYSLQGIPHSERVVRSRVELKITENRRISEQIYDIPFAIYNLIEWLPINNEDIPIFHQQPYIETVWHSACAKLIKHGADYLRKFMPCMQDPKGNYLMKCRLFGQEVFARVLVVLAQAKVQILGGGIALVALGVLQVIV